MCFYDQRIKTMVLLALAFCKSSVDETGCLQTLTTHAKLTQARQGCSIPHLKIPPMSPHKVGIMSQLKSNDFSTRVTHYGGSQKSEGKNRRNLCF